MVPMRVLPVLFKLFGQPISLHLTDYLWIAVAAFFFSSVVWILPHLWSDTNNRFLDD